MGPLTVETLETLRTGTEWFRADDAAVAGSVRRAAVRLAERLSYTETRAGEVGIIASEIASNVWRHASNGTIGVQTGLRDGAAGVRLIALDHGPGMRDLPTSSADGHSTRGTLGVGLGAIERLSSTLDISSQPGKGTVLVADIWATEPPADDSFDIGGITRPIDGEDECGDAIAGRDVDGSHLLMLADGLGHGPMAAASSAEALHAFHETSSTDPVALLSAMHARMNHTRGAAVAVAVIDPSLTSVAFAGVGNVSAFVDDGERRQSAISFPGIVGHKKLNTRPFELTFGPGCVLIMHSDGVSETWNLRDTPGLGRRSSTVIAASVLRDAANRPDDASVIVARRRA